MRELTLYEMNYVAGAIDSNGMTGFDRFWANYAEYAGLTAGLVSGPFLAVGAGVAASLYYGIYTPIYYVAYGIGYGAYAVGTGVYNAGSYLAGSKDS